MLVTALASSYINDSVSSTLSAFFLSISSPEGPSLSLLISLAQLGRAWPTSPFFLLDAKSDAFACVERECAVAASPRGRRNPLLNLIGNVVPALAPKPSAVASCGCDSVLLLNGFYPVGVASLVVGVVWFVFASRHVHDLQELPKDAWRVNKGVAAQRSGADSAAPASPVAYGLKSL